jgi:hypothetical protein
MKSLFRHKILTLLTGVATAALVVFSQLFYFQAANYCQKKADIQHHDKKTDAAKNYISIPSSTISSTSHIEIHQDLSFVLELLFDREPVEETFTISFPVDRFFQTLFRFIISPNAP